LLDLNRDFALPDTEKKMSVERRANRTLVAERNSTDGQFVLCTGPLTAPRWCLLPRRYLRRVPSIYTLLTFSFSPAHSIEYSPRSVIISSLY